MASVITLSHLFKKDYIFVNQMVQVQEYMADAIRGIMTKAYANVLSNPLEAKTVWRLQQVFLKSEKHLFHLHNLQPALQGLLCQDQRHCFGQS